MKPWALTGLGVALLSTLVGAGPAAAGEPTTERWSLLEVPSDTETQALLRTFDVDVEGGDAERLHVLARPADLPSLATAGLSYELLVADMQSRRPEVGEARGMEYHDAQGVLFSLQALATEYPRHVRYVEVGRSVQGRPIGGVLLTDRPEIREFDEPSVRLLGGHHGDEYSSVEVTLDAAWTLAERYAQGQAEAIAFLDNTEVWIAPLVNPDGHIAFTRRNLRGVDLNRNYSYLWEPSGASGDAPFSEPETAAIRQLSNARSFHHSLSVHSGATNLGWVWNSQTEPTTEEPWLEARCADYLGATSDPDFWITNGADWYITYGDTNDWSYGQRGGHDYTLEVSEEKTPPTEDLPEVLARHTAPALDFLSESAGRGILLRVTDSQGRPLEAEVSSTTDGWRGYSDPETGVFSRPVSSGTHSLRVEVLGMSPKLVEVTATQPLQLEDVVVSVHEDVVPSRLIISEGSGGPNLSVCSPRMGDVAGDVELQIHRAGPQPPVGLRGETDPGLPCADFQLDLELTDLIDEPWRREGEWNLAVTDSGGALLALAPLGLLVPAAEPGFTMSSVDIEADRIVNDGSHLVDLIISGEALPPGALIRAVGPAGQRAFPSGRPVDDLKGPLRVQFNVTGWDEGRWSLRIFGAGHHVHLPQVLERVPDGLVTHPIPDPPSEGDDDDSAPDCPPDDPACAEADEEGGCACTVGNLSGRSGVLSLVTVLLVAYSRRTRRRLR